MLILADSSERVTAGMWLLVAIPVVLLVACCSWLAATGGPASRRGVLAVPSRIARSLRRSGLPAWCLGGIGLALWALTTAVIGFMWDVTWHADLGRDTQLFTPPHVMILVGLVMIGGAAVGSVVLATAERATVGWRWRGLRIPRSTVALVVLSVGAVTGFPLDDLWHRTYGIDVTMWSPTHLLMIGGASLAPIALWLMLAEAGPESPRPRFRRWLQLQLAGSVLLGLSTFQLEFDLGIPQWQALYQPVLIAAATSIGLVAARAVLGRGGAVKVALWFVVFRALMAVLIGPVLGHSLPRLPLYLGIALCIEAAFAIGERRRLQPLALALLNGALIGTVGLGTEWAFSHAWGYWAWQPSMFPGFVAAMAMAVAGAVVGMAMGRVLAFRPPQVGRAALLASGVAIVALLAVPAPRNGLAATATVRTARVGPSSPALDREGYANVRQDVSVDVTVSPSNAAEQADSFYAVAWQGGGIVLRPLQRVGPGEYRAGAVPTGGAWKSMVVLLRRDVVAGVPISFPRDHTYGLPAIPAPAARTATFVPSKKYLMREDHGGAVGVAVLAYIAFVLVCLVWVTTLAVTFSAIRPGGRGPGRRRVAAGRLAAGGAAGS